MTSASDDPLGHASPGPGDEYVFNLYVAGTSPKAVRAAANLAALARHLPANSRIEVIDVLENPAAAHAAGVIATPVLVRVSPGPVRRALGDLTDVERFAATVVAS